MMVVAAVTAVILAIAIPNMVSVISSARQRNIMMMVSGIMQQCRSQAVNRNTPMWVADTNVGTQKLFYVKDPTVAQTLASSDAQVPLGDNVKYYRTPTGANAPAALTASQMWNSSATVNTTDNVAFNSRGLPCVYNTNTSMCATGSGFVMYFNYLPPFGSNRWAAMSVSPAGRVKAWYWSGGAWGN
jgi:Tfp pilus assembly protein FimT